MTNASTHDIVPELNDVRPPDETLVKSYHIERGDTWEHIGLDELTPVSEIPDKAHPSGRVPSLELINEEHEFVIVQRAYNPDDPNERFVETDLDWDGIGYIRLYAPEYKVEERSLEWEDTNPFETWEDAEQHIADNIDQPDRHNEIIQPVTAEAFIYDVQSYLFAVEQDNQPEIEMHSHRFHRHTPNEDVFYAYK